MKFEKFSWSGRVDENEGAEALRMHQIVNVTDLIENFHNANVLIGFASDEGVKRNQGRVGASRGPYFFRKAFASLPVVGINTFYDIGDVLCDDTNLEHAQNALAEAVSFVLDKHGKPLVIGGGHEVAYASYLGLQKSLLKKSTNTDLLIINLDAHFDLRLGKESTSGTPFAQILEQGNINNLNIEYCCVGISKLSNTQALFNRAKLFNVDYLLDSEADDIESIIIFLKDKISKYNNIYLSIDLDVLPSYQAPGVSAPAAYGVGLDKVEKVLEFLKQTNKLRLVDIAELNPDVDIDNRTAKTAARLVWKYWCD